MERYRLGVLASISLLQVCLVPFSVQAACPDLLAYTFPSLQDNHRPLPLCQFAGKVILVVNTASHCGYTNQYDGLEKLYAEKAADGLVVLGFPSNDFGQQEPGSDKEIADFCRTTYGVKFPMTGKNVIRGKDANPFYRQLAHMTGSTPQWNFHKYLISRDSRQVLAFDSAVRPDDKHLLQQINTFLKQ